MRFSVHNRIQPIIWNVELRAETQADFEIRILINDGSNQICQCRPDAPGSFFPDAIPIKRWSSNIQP